MYHVHKSETINLPPVKTAINLSENDLLGKTLPTSETPQNAIVTSSVKKRLLPMLLSSVD